MTTFTPAPKPEPRSPRLAKRIAPISEKQKAKRKARGETFISRTVSPSKKAPKARNAKRKASEFQRCYHSVERVEFVQSLPCFATGIKGRSDNAHVVRDGSEGMGRKGGYRCIAPLTREAHRLFDTNPARFTERYGDLDPQAMADWTQREWEKFVGRVRGGER